MKGNYSLIACFSAAVLAWASSSMGGTSSGERLRSAIRAGDTVQLQALLRRGADPNVPDPLGHRPLYWAVLKGKPSLVECLLDNGADIAAFDRHGGQPIHTAALLGRTDMIRLLLEHGADPNARAPDMNVLICAVSHKDTLVYLLRHGADVNSTDAEGQSTALHIAALEGQLDCVVTLVRAGATIDAINKFGASPLSMAVMGDHLPVVRYLLSCGAQPTASSPSAFSAALKNRNPRAMAMLVSATVRGHVAIAVGIVAALALAVTGFWMSRRVAVRVRRAG